MELRASESESDNVEFRRCHSAGTRRFKGDGGSAMAFGLNEREPKAERAFVEVELLFPQPRPGCRTKPVRRSAICCVSGRLNCNEGFPKILVRCTRPGGNTMTAYLYIINCQVIYIDDDMPRLHTSSLRSTDTEPFSRR
jgi:hypothetical protein